MMNQPKIKAYWKSAAMLLVAFGVQALLFLLLLYMYVLDKGNPSVLEILSSVLIFAATARHAAMHPCRETFVLAAQRSRNAVVYIAFSGRCGTYDCDI